ncbi:unnamed protein product [Psylliodes chrysocephalus]|uniref:DUF4218 domain-containing protein n=1 Tax=Psylliodes chrysocephalus TaxID=3402493 RepID=A0A9P0G492_9CUCU|nr:unnamed protein product [Psylliodes chrysocephala]
MVSMFPIDYMHCICLGVVRKMLFIWKSGNRSVRLNEKYNLLEKKIKELGNCWPIEFNRKPRSLQYLDYWKASELRQFILYVSPLLYDILPEHMFCNLMLLKYAVTILLNKDLNSFYNEYANKLLISFVKNAIQIYGKEFCVYNVHSLIHLASDAQKFESLNDISCFPFENHLYFLKTSLRKSNHCLQQVLNRILEGRKPIHTGVYKKNIYVSEGSTENIKFLRKTCVNNTVWTIDSGNNCAFINDNDSTILYIQSIFEKNNKIYFKGRHLQKIKPFLDYPTASDIIHLYEVSINSIEGDIVEYTHSAKDIKFKGLLLKMTETYIVCPLNHFD